MTANSLLVTLWVHAFNKNPAWIFQAGSETLTPSLVLRFAVLVLVFVPAVVLAIVMAVVLRPTVVLVAATAAVFPPVVVPVTIAIDAVVIAVDAVVATPDDAAID